MKNREILTWISKSIKGKKKHIVILTIIQIALGFLSVCFAFLLKYVTHGLEIKDKKYFLISIYILLGIVLLILVLNCIYRFIYEHINSNIENTLKEKLFNDLLLSNYKIVKDYHKEDWIHRLSEDTKIVTSNILSIFPVIGRMSIQFILAFILIIYISPKFGLILLPISFILLILTCILRKRLKLYHNAVLEEEGKYKIFLSESLEGLSIIHSFVKESLISNIDSKKLENYKKAKIKRNNFSIFCSLGFLLLYYGSYVFGIIFCGLKILNGNMDIASLMSIIALLTQIQSPISNMTSILPHYYSMLASAERLILNDEKENIKQYTSKEVENIYSNFEEINIKNISFSYNESKKILSNFSLNIKKNQHIALIGHSGIGKSTLFKLLLSLYDLNCGTIEIKSKSNIKPLSKEDRNLFGYVPQDNLILKGSIKDNVTFFSSNVNEKKLQLAYKNSASNEFINSLPNKDLTILNERGSGLSIGQLQRLSLARAYYSDKPILLLDEITSSLDSFTSKKVIDNLFSMKDKTIIFITHHEENLPDDVIKIKLGE